MVGGRTPSPHLDRDPRSPGGRAWIPGGGGFPRNCPSSRRRLGARNASVSRHRRRRVAFKDEEEEEDNGAVGMLISEERRGAMTPLLKDSTAVLRDGSGHTAYVLGVSHVSKESCNLIEELIHLVQPDAVMVELCKERTGLLIDGLVAQSGGHGWFTRRVDIQGVPRGKYWPSKESLIQLTMCGCGRPVSTQQIQQDADTLLATGLFESVVPVTGPPPAAWDPKFAVQSGENPDDIVPAVQLSSITFKVVPRTVPVAIISVTVVNELLDVAGDLGEWEAALQATVDEVLRNENITSLDTLLAVRHSILNNAALDEELRMSMDITFEGIEGGDVKVRVGAPQKKKEAEKNSFCESSRSDMVQKTGLEGTVDGQGKGIGIRPLSRPFSPRTEPLGQPQSLGSPIITPWKEDKLKQNQKSSKNFEAPTEAAGSSSIVDSLAGMITSIYASYQAEAGKRVGISPGEAWRVALASSARNNVGYFFLGDRPASETGVRLAEGIVAGWIPYILAAIAISAGSWMIAPSLTDSSIFSSGVATAATIASLTAASWPLISPILEVREFSKLSPQRIEEAVRVKEPLQRKGDLNKDPFYLWGEDALIRWPGAESPIIKERDVYMAFATYAILNNLPKGLTPLYLRQSDALQDTYEYCQPDGSNANVCPTGKGAGYITCPDSINTVVSIVGTAHVRGIVTAWQKINDGTLCNESDPLESFCRRR